ncbi:hypothetical protein PH547_29570 [Rhizobium sp. CNPSo 3464]|uniref:hypothetical protein n=1 Tax=Rhizobium sp. CNPSo 3464 TaxID=3021406 RepID=UPI0025507BEF|nr:hypothetical protein [Rhizobium sp. CNPSo 3464]MDK4743040.1 hypothetical protein [Rhizobium sp. CNPSo 3464]
MPKFSVMRPSSILDFSDEDWLYPDRAFALKLYGRFRRLDLIEILPETDRLALHNARAAMQATLRIGNACLEQFDNQKGDGEPKR